MSSSTKAVLLKLSSGEVLICKVGLPDAAGAFQPVADWTEVVGRVDVDVLELDSPNHFSINSRAQGPVAFTTARAATETRFDSSTSLTEIRYSSAL